MLFRSLLVAVGVVGVAVAWGEWRGWPWLAQPLATGLSHVLHRPVTLASAAGQPAVRVHFVPTLRIEAPALRIGGPAWSPDQDLLRLTDGTVVVGYGQLWQVARGGPIHLREVSARGLQLQLEQDDLGRANWQLGDAHTAAHRLSAISLRLRALCSRLRSTSAANLPALRRCAITSSYSSASVRSLMLACLLQT